jgi:hypothetical protein
VSDFFQPVDPAAAPDAVTPADTPGDASGYAMVTGGSDGPAAYDIAADNGEAAITAAFDAANAVAGGGILYPRGPRQTATEALLYSPQGFSSGTGTSGYDIPQGFSGEPDGSWPNNVQASSVLETPIQGEMGAYPAGSTTQDGVQKYGC